MSDPSYALGVDFGTESGRVLLLDLGAAKEVAVAAIPYASAVIDRELPGTGERLGHDWALQDPDDWVRVLERAIREVIEESGVDAGQVVGLGIDFTSCTVLPTTGDGTPLCTLEQWRERRQAWPKLWKHHAAQPVADRLNEVALERGEDFLARYGGRISSEWEFAKALQLLDEDPDTYQRTERWIEAADWIIWQLCGEETRNACTAGYKGIYQDGHYPSADYLKVLNADFADFAQTRLAGVPLAGPDGPAPGASTPCLAAV